MPKKVAIPPELVDETSLPVEARFLYVLLQRLSGQSNTCSVSWRKLSALLGISTRATLQKYVSALARAGWVEITPPRGKRPTAYLLCNPYEIKRQQEYASLKNRIDRSEAKGEALMREWLNLLVNSTFYYDHARPDFLVNPITGQPMEYDRWYPPSVAFEFNGPQHYGPTELYPDVEAVNMQKARDAMKQGMSTSNGVALVVVCPDDLSYDGMLAKIGSLLPVRPVSKDEFLVYQLSLLSNAYRRKARIRLHSAQH